ncbi:LysR family transcriptional regulator [Pseudomonas typographi]|uniref:LysR family transcriptional regulator n=1 Tax=Pseudomonas typographi TaxID=2715964 RepID=A0ABR7Z4I2_9PSED|nr:LysR family transcriptional regulator [Pseudomonas typographi]MBD1553979.1 LysR family transcriptional regulator [Pseudomonas typographi]MBD1588059.1 LysR family transcriptional regulator [Pseudomonas typographi]MBD1600388.1 LysR family transcriptional regulator [Pseudomonas typographi]
MIRELRTFLAAARRGSFVGAGQQIGLTPSAVSAQLRNLEQALGVQLFERSARAVQLSAAGQRAVPLAEEILALFARMGAAPGEGAQRGTLRIGAINTAQTGLLAPALVRLRERAPAVEVQLVPGVSLNLLAQVDAAELDLAILIRPPFPLPKELEATLLAEEPFVLAVPAGVPGDCPLTLLREQPFIRYERASFGGRQVSRFLLAQRLNPRQVLELDELDAIIRMVQSGLGVALIPRAGLWLANPVGLRVLPLGEWAFSRELVLVAPRRASPLQRLFTECVLA